MIVTVSFVCIGKLERASEAWCKIHGKWITSQQNYVNQKSHRETRPIRPERTKIQESDEWPVPTVKRLPSSTV